MIGIGFYELCLVVLVAILAINPKQAPGAIRIIADFVKILKTTIFRAKLFIRDIVTALESQK